MGAMGDSAYAEAGVDTARAESAVAALVAVLKTIDPGRESRAVLGSGHYANVLRIDDRTGIALSTDGVGSKIIVAEELGRYDTVGVDCIAMNVNDVICVGAEPIAVLDYIAVEAVVTGASIRPGDAVIGLPSSGVHSNGYTLARRALPDLGDTPPELGGRRVGDVLLEPTVIYVRAALEVLRSPDVEVRGLAHITSGGMLNLLRLEADVGYRIDRPLPVLPIFDLIADAAGVPPEEMYEVFNMGCGFCCVVPQEHADLAGELLAGRHRGARPIGVVTDRAGVVELPAAGLAGGEEGLRPSG